MITYFCRYITTVKKIATTILALRFPVMKKTILILFLFASFSSYAQHKPFQFGFRGAANLGWLKSDLDNFNNDGAQFGGSWGGVADFFLMENYSFTTGFNVIYLNVEGSLNAHHMQGDSLLIEGTITEKVKTKYVQIPIIFTMKTNRFKDKFSVFGQIGYGFGILLQAKRNSQFISDDGSYSEENNDNNYDGYTSIRSSLILGIGVEIPLHKSTVLRTGFTFDNCFVDISKSDEVKIRSNFIELNAAVIF